VEYIKDYLERLKKKDKSIEKIINVEEEKADSYAKQLADYYEEVTAGNNSEEQVKAETKVLIENMFPDYSVKVGVGNIDAVLEYKKITQSVSLNLKTRIFRDNR